MNYQNIQEGSIVLAPFPHMETEEKKLRPALIWSTTPVSVKLVYISTKKLSAAFPTEVVLNDDEAARIGLSQSSRIDFGKRVNVPITDVKKQFGHIIKLPKRTLRRLSLAAEAAGLLDE